MKQRSWSDRLRRMMASHERNEAADMAERAIESGCVTIEQARIRERVSLIGTVTSMRTNARGWPEVQLNDPTGTVTLVWMGTQRLAAITPGCHLIATGRLTLDGERPVIFNPGYQVIG